MEFLKWLMEGSKHIRMEQKQHIIRIHNGRKYKGFFAIYIYIYIYMLRENGHQKDIDGHS
jgi:hypothetical protein